MTTSLQETLTDLADHVRNPGEVLATVTLYRNGGCVAETGTDRVSPEMWREIAYRMSRESFGIMNQQRGMRFRVDCIRAFGDD